MGVSWSFQAECPECVDVWRVAGKAHGQQLQFGECPPSRGTQRIMVTSAV